MSKNTELYKKASEAIPGEDDKNFVLRQVRNGWCMGYEKAEKDLGWISVKDRLPEKNGWYFTCVEQFKIPQCVGITYFDKEDGWWLDDIPTGKKSFMTTIEIVDYWMEIPELPKK